MRRWREEEEVRFHLLLWQFLRCIHLTGVQLVHAIVPEGYEGVDNPAVLSRGWLNRFLVEACFRLYLRGSFNENELIVFKFGVYLLNICWNLAQYCCDRLYFLIWIFSQQIVSFTSCLSEVYISDSSPVCLNMIFCLVLN